MYDDLRWFIAIAETQNLTAAADRVHSRSRLSPASSDDSNATSG